MPSTLGPTDTLRRTVEVKTIDGLRCHVVRTVTTASNGRIRETTVATPIGRVRKAKRLSFPITNPYDLDSKLPYSSAQDSMRAIEPVRRRLASELDTLDTSSSTTLVDARRHRAELRQEVESVGSHNDSLDLHRNRLYGQDLGKRLDATIERLEEASSQLRKLKEEVEGGIADDSTSCYSTMSSSRSAVTTLTVSTVRVPSGPRVTSNHRMSAAICAPEDSTRSQARRR
ncbi:MAG: hypothetical protein MMC23_003027 [Stictis urceolatum]|nr:hypothetical protein [Stictis urceolata]